MSQTIATASDLDTYLGLSGAIDTARASLLLDLAFDKCSAIVTPVPTTAKGLLLEVAGRAYTNPSSAHSLNLGSAGAAFGAPSSSTGIGGLYLSKANKSELRRLAGRGGAYTFDPTPADAGQGLMPWEQNVTWFGNVPLAEDGQ